MDTARTKGQNSAVEDWDATSGRTPWQHCGELGAGQLCRQDNLLTKATFPPILMGRAKGHFSWRLGERYDDKWSVLTSYGAYRKRGPERWRDVRKRKAAVLLELYQWIQPRVGHLVRWLLDKLNWKPQKGTQSKCVEFLILPCTLIFCFVFLLLLRLHSPIAFFPPILTLVSLSLYPFSHSSSFSPFSSTLPTWPVPIKWAPPIVPH